MADTLHSAVSDQWLWTLHLAFHTALQGSVLPIPMQTSQMMPERKLLLRPVDDVARTDMLPECFCRTSDIVSREESNIRRLMLINTSCKGIAHVFRLLARSSVCMAGLAEEQIM